MRTVTFLAVFFWALGLQAVDTGKTAPDFSLMGSDGKTHRLSEYRGKPVVLEWFNDKCPFVEKHYKSGNMQGLQERFTGQGVVWLSVISSAEGNQGHVDRSGALKLIEKNKSRQTAILLDSEGTLVGPIRPRPPPTSTWSPQRATFSIRGPSTTNPLFNKATLRGRPIISPRPLRPPWPANRSRWPRLRPMAVPSSIKITQIIESKLPHHHNDGAIGRGDDDRQHFYHSMYCHTRGGPSSVQPNR